MVHVYAGHAAKRPLPTLRIWHLSALVVYVAVAIVDLQQQRTTEPPLIALASAGFVGYALVVALGWRWLGRARVHPMLGLVLYLVAMAVLFLVAAVTYVALENLYRMGHL